MKKSVCVGIATGAAALVLASCGEAPDEAGGGGATEGGDTEFQSCMVSDEGGINDQSFNETSYRGLQNAYDAGLTLEPQFAESQSPSDYVPNVEAMVADDCQLIVTVGFELAAATREAAEANPEEQFAIVDYQYSEEADGVSEVDGVKPLVFNTQEAAFLAGYVAASHSETGTVATWGGAEIPTVTIFMDGFYDGVQQYNEDTGEQVEVLGWDKESQQGQFVGDFSNTGLAKQISDNLISQGADVLHPVAGPLAASAGQAAQEAGDVEIVWADSDGHESAPEFSDIMLTSVMKSMDVAVEDTVSAAVDGNFNNDPYVGTLENEGVAIAPFHEFEDEVPQEVKDRVDELREQIISGDLVVESPAAF